MIRFDAWHLPGLAAHELALREHTFGELKARVPALAPDQLQRVFAHVDNARRTTLLRLPVRAIAAAIDQVAATLAANDSPEGAAARELLPPATGYSRETIDDVLAHMTRDWRSDSLERLLLSELADPAVLDQPTVLPGANTACFARGPRLAFHVFAGNVPGVAVTSLVRSLLVKAGTFGKTASGEPVLSVLFARTLARVAPRLADCLAVTYWTGGTEELEAAALAAADAVVVYGAAETVAALARRIPPGSRLVVHGPKLSFGVVGREAGPEAARSIAAATAAYDQQGCVSPHVVYVERGGAVAPRDLAAQVSEELGRLERVTPRRKLSAAEALAVRDARTSAEFRSFGSATVELFGAEDARHTVIYDEALALPVSCLNRTLFVIPVDRAEDVVALLEARRDVLQSVALAGFTAARMRELTKQFAHCGVSRITSFEALPWPPMWWHHDGRGPLRELLTWTDLEA